MNFSSACEVGDMIDGNRESTGNNRKYKSMLYEVSFCNKLEVH